MISIVIRSYFGNQASPHSSRGVDSWLLPKLSRAMVADMRWHGSSAATATSAGAQLARGNASVADEGRSAPTM